MKKIINGRMYDTTTATIVGEWWNKLSKQDFRYCSESLFRKKTGEFFLFGEGGALSPYCESVDLNCWCGSSKIIPLTEEEAREWCENHLDADEYIEIFGEVEE